MAAPRSTSDPVVGGEVHLQVAGATKRFGGVQALADVDLAVRRGQAVALIGPNGAGKSTMLKAIGGIHRLDAGTVTLDGVRLDTLPTHRVVRTGVGLAHQVPRPFPSLTVRENVLVGAVARAGGRRGRAAADHVAEVLDLCGLSAKADVPASALRLLDLKRLEVARALGTAPSLVLLDEVAAGLVGHELDEAIAMVRRVHESGRTIVLVEHIERVVRELVDHVLVLDWGRPIAAGTPAEIARDEQVRAVYLGEGTTSRPAAERRRAASPAEAPAPVLELEGVSAGYGRMLAVQDVTLHVGAGEIVAVLGANGAGKSTLSGMVSGLVPIRRGAVRAFGRDITRLPAHRRARMGIAHCQEGRHVFAELSVAENLALGAPLSLQRSELAERVADIERIFPRLAERRDQPAGTLSGGEQQMLAVGRALMSRPRLLVCDEISLGLAPLAVEALYEALRAVNDDGVAIVLVEQNVHRGLEIADRAYVLSRGTVSYAGPPEPLLDESTLVDAYFGAPAEAPASEALASEVRPRRKT